MQGCSKCWFDVNSVLYEIPAFIECLKDTEEGTHHPNSHRSLCHTLLFLCKMAMAFESPGHLERRIAANMAADVSSDSSLGISRKGRSIASLSMSTTFEEDENRSYMADYMRTNMETPNLRVQEHLRRAKTPRTTRKLAEIVNSSSASSSTSKSDVKSSTVKAIERTPAKSEASFVTESSTNDLLISQQAALRPNSSFPGFGANQNGMAANVQIDDKRLHSLLHKMNEKLEEENVELTEAKNSLQIEFERALLDNERLRKQIGLKNSIPSTTPIGSPNVGRTSEEADELQREVNLLKRELSQQESIIERMSRERSDQRADEDSMDHLRERISELESELKQERNARQDDEDHYKLESEAAIDEAKRLKKQLEEERTTAQTKMDRIRTELERAKKEDSHIGNEEIDALSEDLRLAEARLDEYSEKIRELESENNELQERESDMVAELEEYDRLREEHEILIKGYNERESEIEKIQDELNAANDKVSDLEIIVSEKENDRLTLELKLSQAKESGELHRLREKVLLLETTLEMTREAAAAREVPAFSEAKKGRLSEGDITPIHPNVAALRKPIDTPNSPPVLAELSNASWMQSQATLGENAIKREMSMLRHEYDAARKVVDDKIERLQEANVFQDLVKANEEIGKLENKISEMQSKEDRIQRRLEKLQCKSCKTRISMPTDLDESRSMSMNNSIGETSSLRSSVHSSYQQNGEILRKVTDELNELKDHWAIDIERIEKKARDLDAERNEILKEREQMQKHRQGTKDRVSKMQIATIQGLGKARRMIETFSAEIQTESARFKSMKDNRNAMDQESFDLEQELERTRVQYEKIERELKNKIAVYEKLDAETKDRSTIDDSLAMHVYTLQVNTEGFAQEVERLRFERILILQERQKLYERRQQHQQKLLNTSEELRMAKETMQAHQAHIDDQVNKIERLHEDLRKKNVSLERVQSERDQVYEQRCEIVEDVAQLEDVLKKVREESLRFGLELDDLREKRMQNSRQSTYAIDRQQHKREIEAIRNRYEKSLTQLLEENDDRKRLDASRHQSECRGLLLQIRYEKAKYMRESDLRADLIHQKKYLLGLVGGLELNEEATVRFLADLEKSRGVYQSRLKMQQFQRKAGYDYHSVGLKKFKSAAFAVVAICRAKKMAENWQISLQIKSSLRQAHSLAKKARLSEEAGMPAPAAVKTVK